MIHLIPPSTKEKSRVFLWMTWIDILVFFIGLSFGGLFLLLNLNNQIKFFSLLIIIGITFILVMDYGNIRGYQLIFYAITFKARQKKMKDISLKEDCEVSFEKDIVKNPTMKSKIIEIHGIDFLILPTRKQDVIINQLSDLYKNIAYGKIVKLDKPCDFTNYINQNDEKLDKLIEEVEERILYYDKLGEDMPEDEALGFETRLSILQNYSENFLRYHQEMDKIDIQTFYLIMYDTDEETLNYTCRQALYNIRKASIDAHVLNGKEVKEFYELFYDKKFDEEEDFYLPEVIEHSNSITIDGSNYRISSIEKLPLTAINGWLANVFRLKGTKCVLNFRLENNKQKIYKTINKSIVELKSHYADKNLREDQKIDLDIKISGLEELLDKLKIDGESIHVCSFFIMYPEGQKKDIEQVFKDVSIYTDKLLFRQFKAYLSMQPYVYQLEQIKSVEREFHSTTLSATFPFVTKTFMDEEGMFLGSGSDYVFFDQFYSWKNLGEKRTSANMVVLGKTGGGKSYFMKKSIMQHLCNGVKVFVLDPENEYEWLCHCFGGNLIDIGGVKDGIINPLQVFATLKSDEDSNEQGFGEVSSHRQFLQEFFSILLPKLDNRCFVYLDEAIGELYNRFNITDKTDIQTLKPEDFPTFEDLYNLIDEITNKELGNSLSLQHRKESLDLLRDTLKSIKKGGVFSNLWNGHTTLVLKNDFTVLNFQSLFSSNNKTIASAQMILVTRYLMQEIIKNKNNNDLYGTDKNVLVAVDEAHQFIDPKFPVALDFMSQMVKRIRKYGGAMTITTQNISDFIGHAEETKAKATAVINGCQYSMVFGLNPNDINNMIELYSTYNGGLTQNEIDIMADAMQGEALFLIDSNTRMSIYIQTVNGEEQYMIKPKTTNYDEFNYYDEDK